MSTSFEKLYELDKTLTYSFAIFDYDPGSTTESQISDYFPLKETVDNFYSVLSSPGVEAYFLQHNFKEIRENFREIVQDKKLAIIDDLMNVLLIEENGFFLNKSNDVASIVKKLKKQLSRSEKLNGDSMKNSKEYLQNNLGEIDNFYLLENQKTLFENKIISQDTIMIISFIFTIFENICDWIIGEDE